MAGAGFAGTQRANEPGTNIWNELVTPDFDKAAAFYTATLGTEQQDMPDGSGSYSMFTVGGKTVAGSMTPPMEGVPPHWNFYFNVDDVDTTAAKAKELGTRRSPRPSTSRESAGWRCSPTRRVRRST